MSLQSFRARVLQGDPRRRSRLHDYEGNRIDWAGMRFLAHSIGSALLLKSTGRYSRRPWLGYRTVRRLDALLRSDWRALEFGSGQSTVWLARRCRELVSVESNPEWHARVAARLRAEHLTRVDNRLCRDRAAYLALEDCRPGTFDFALVDGDWRDQATARSLELVRPGGYILLDNSDVPLADHRAAKRMLEQAAAPNGGLERFIDFAPMKVAVNQALLVRIAGAP